MKSLLTGVKRTFLALLLCVNPVVFANETTVEPGVRALERGHYSTAMRSWLPLAREGVAEAQNNVGLMYERGLGVTQNYPEAMVWYRQAADQGLPEANLNLGLLYYSGYGTQVNDREAYRRFRAAAADTLAEAQYMVGLMHFSGRGTAQSFVEAYRGFLDAAKQGYPEAQYMLSYLLLSGDLGRMQPEASFVWSKIAKDQGFADAEELNYLATLELDAAAIALAEQRAAQCLSSNYQNCPE
ncbi:MAG: tetratricopeptide repeat protein [Litorivicinaceae bacterium]